MMRPACRPTATAAIIIQIRFFKTSSRRRNAPSCRGARARHSSGSLVLARERVARDVRVPVDKRAVRVVLPTPDMQGVEGGQSEAVRSFKKMEELPHELRRFLVGFVPLLGDH